MAKSLLDLTYECLSQSKEPVNFKDLWAYVVEKAGLDEATASKKISSLYTNLMLDGRFVTLGDNKWDLRSRHTFDKVHIDMKDVYSDIDNDDGGDGDSDDDDYLEDNDEKDSNDDDEESLNDEEEERSEEQ